MRWVYLILIAILLVVIEGSVQLKAEKQRSLDCCLSDEDLFETALPEHRGRSVPGEGSSFRRVESESADKLARYADSLGMSKISTLYNFWIDARKIELSGNYAYICTSDSELKVVDISDPYNPIELYHAWEDENGPILFDDFTVSGQLLYRAYDMLIYVYDISDPSSPVQIGLAELIFRFASDMKVSDKYLYVYCDCIDENYFEVFDVSDPHSPHRVGWLTNFYPDYNSVMAVYGDYVHIAGRSCSLMVYDVSDKTSPTVVGNCYTGSVEGMEVSGHYLYLAGWNHGLKTLDISDPTAPAVLGQYPLEKAEDVVVLGNYAYVTNGEKIIVFDVSDPASPVKLHEYSTVDYCPELVVRDRYAYVANKSEGVSIVKVFQPTETYSYTNYEAEDVVTFMDYYYVAGGEDGLIIFDISDPSSPVEVSVYDTPGIARGIYVKGITVPVLGRVAQGSARDASYPRAGMVAKIYAYIADSGAGLRIIDVTNPSNPIEVGYCDTPGTAFGVYVAGDYTYVADGRGGLRIIDVSDKTSPVEVGSYDTPGSAMDVFVKGTLAYIADYDAGLRILDVSNPAAPSKFSYYDTPDATNGVIVDDRFAYLADGTGGLRIIDVSDPYYPESVGQLVTPGYAHGVVVKNGLAYIADSELCVVDVSDPAVPVYVCGYDMPSRAYSVVLMGKFCYVADLDMGLRVIEPFYPV